MYTCIHRAASGTAAATSSSGQVASEDRISSAPAAAAPRAVATSPSGCASPWIAVGATPTGVRTGVPSRVVAVETSATPASTRGWSCQWPQAATFPARRRSSSAPPA